MAYRTITVSNGDTIRISESVLRGSGPEGPKGPLGPPGTATTIRGHFASYEEMVIYLPEGSQGDAYITDDDGVLWSWDSLHDVPQWVECGRIVGPASVLSVGATRSIDSAVLIRSGIQWIATYDITDNDEDSLTGSVLDMEQTSDTVTVVDPDEYMYYLVTTTFTVQSSVFNQLVEFVYQNLTDGTFVGRGTVQINGDVDFTGQHQMIVKCNNTARWQLLVTPSDDCDVSTFSTVWNRIAGGPGRDGPAGPPPIMVAGETTATGYDQPPTFSFIEGPPGTYTMDLTVPQGIPGNADSGFTQFDDLIVEENSEVDPGEVPDTWTDQLLPVPDRAAKPYVPWYFRLFSEGIYRRLVSRLTSTQKNDRGAPEKGEVVYDTDLEALFLGQLSGTATAWFQVPTQEYGQDANVYHNAPTTRPDGSLYFKYDS